MPPRRDFSGKMDYQHRNIHDYFLEQSPSSIDEIVKSKELVPKIPRLKI